VLATYETLYAYVNDTPLLTNIIAGMHTYTYGAGLVPSLPIKLTAARTESFSKQGRVVVDMMLGVRLPLSAPHVIDVLYHSLSVLQQGLLLPQGPGGWTARLESDRASFVDLHVPGCYFFEFFARHKAPLLVQVFCRWHSRWGSCIQAEYHKVRFRQIKALPEGDSECVFRLEAAERARDEAPAPRLCPQ